eukprot:3421154-Prymnesium_polylepis.2
MLEEPTVAPPLVHVLARERPHDGCRERAGVGGDVALVRGGNVARVVLGKLGARVVIREGRGSRRCWRVGRRLCRRLELIRRRRGLERVGRFRRLELIRRRRGLERAGRSRRWRRRRRREVDPLRSAGLGGGDGVFELRTGTWRGWPAWNEL